MNILYISEVDKYGVKNYNPILLILFGFIILYSYIAVASFPLYIVESSSPDCKLSTYRDAFWLLQMAASTIGFGEVYPVTETDRFIVALTFYIGVGIAGFIGATIASIFTKFSDTSIQNRELRKQNEEILNQINQLNQNKG